jgi:L-iditol 2-dehydrogenase
VELARLTGVGDVHLFVEPDPTPGPGESLVRVGAVGLCGSDLHWFGQEFGGTVEGGSLDGQRVAVDPAIADNVCERCREGNNNLCPNVRFAGHGGTDGGLRQYVAWPTDLLHRVPDSFSDGAVALLEPLGVALHAYDLGHVRYGSTVAVVGCGPIGLMVIQVARSAGAASIVAVEPLPQRRAAAARCGADHVLSPEEAKASGLQVDVSFEVAGNDDAIATTMLLVRPGGRVVLAGIPDDDRTSFPAGLARRKGLTIAVVRRMKEAYPRAISVVERGVVELDWLITSSFGLDDIAEAFKVAVAREGLKTVVQIGTPSGVSNAKGGPA